MSKKNYGTAGNFVEFDASGLDNVEKLLTSIEPAVVNAEIEYLREAARKIIALIRDNIEETHVVLKKSIMGIIEIYGGGQQIFCVSALAEKGRRKTNEKNYRLTMRIVSLVGKNTDGSQPGMRQDSKADGPTRENVTKEKTSPFPKKQRKNTSRRLQT